MAKGKKKEEIDLENIINNLPGYIYWKNNNFQYMGCNKNLANISGLNDSSEIAGKTDADFDWGKEQAESFRQDDREVMASGIVKITEHVLPISSANSNQMFVRTEKIPLCNKEGKAIGVLGVALDISDLKKTENALSEQIRKTEQAYKSKAEFLATASHEIRNPIGNVIYSIDNTYEIISSLKNVIYGAIDIFNEAGKHELIKQIQSYFKQIFEQSEQTKAESFRALNSLINLGNLHRLQIEGIKPNYEISNIVELVNSAIENSIYPNKTKVDIHIDISSDILNEIIIDYNNLYETLRVIIGNAIRFSDNNGIVKIELSCSRQDEKKLLIIKVQDFGIGIAESQLDHLFETLHLNNSDNLSNGYWKPSLQLPQAKMRIQAAGGELQVKSIPKKGTTVTITTPYFEANAEVVSYSILEDKANEMSCSILLVEDDVFAQNMVKGYLEEYQHRVDIASTSAEAVKMAYDKNYDIILMDITLPDKNGVETKKTIQQNSYSKSIYIAVTSHASEHDIEYFISQGFVTVLAKPVNKLLLNKCIKNVIIARVSEDNEDD